MAVAEQLRSYERVCLGRLLGIRGNALSITQLVGQDQPETVPLRIINFLAHVDKTVYFNSRRYNAMGQLVTIPWRDFLKRYDFTPRLEIEVSYWRGKTSAVHVSMIGENMYRQDERIIHLYLPPERGLDAYTARVDLQSLSNISFNDWIAGSDSHGIGMLELTLGKVSSYFKSYASQT